MSPASSSASLLKKRPPRPSSAAHTIVTIKVGRVEKAYYIYEDLLTHCSGYFRAAFTGSFKEAQEKQLHLEDVTGKTFDFFVDWLYQRNLPGQKNSSYAKDKDGEEYKSFLNQYEVTKIHIFADRYDIPDLQRDTIDTMFTYFRYTKKIPTAETIRMAFESLPDTSLLCKLLAHQYCESKSDVTSEDESLWTHEIVHAVLARYRYVFRSKRIVVESDICDYHDHANKREKIECQNEREIEELYS